MPDTEAINRFCQKYNISLLLLFGSRAKGTDHPESDLDLGLLFDGLYDIEEVTKGLMNLFKGHEIDIVVLNKSDPLLNFEIIINHKLLFCKDEEIFLGFYTKAVKQYSDMQKIYELEKEYLNEFIGGKRNGTNRCYPPKIN